MAADFDSDLYNISSVVQVMNATTNTTQDVTTTRTFDDIVGDMRVKQVGLALKGTGQMSFDSFKISFCGSRNGNDKPILRLH